MTESITPETLAEIEVRKTFRGGIVIHLSVSERDAMAATIRGLWAEHNSLRG